MQLCRRRLHLQEWQGKQLLSAHSINTQRFTVITHPHHIDAVCRDIKWDTVVVKAQCEAGGRGKGRFLGSGLRGVEVLFNRPPVDSIKTTVKGMLGDRLVTAQTGPEGVIVDKVMVAEGRVELGPERYIAIVLDRNKKQPMVMVSGRGGVAVEEHSHEVVLCDPTDTFGIARVLQVDNVDSVKRLIMQLHDLFTKNDALMVEINPLCVMPGEEPLAVDAKITIDDNALFRHPGRFADTSNADSGNYVKLDDHVGGYRRTVGCMVNGAGLAMATMDMLNGAACNFLDVGGTATPATIKSAMQTLLSDGRVKKVFVNIFGGIVRCDVIADGIKQALSDSVIKAIVKERVERIVVRLAGNNAQVGLATLRGIEKVIPCGDLKTAATLATCDNTIKYSMDDMAI